MLLDQDFDCSTFVGNTDYNCNTFLLFKYVSFTKVHLIICKATWNSFETGNSTRNNISYILMLLFDSVFPIIHLTKHTMVLLKLSITFSRPRLLN